MIHNDPLCCTVSSVSLVGKYPKFGLLIALSLFRGETTAQTQRDFFFPAERDQAFVLRQLTVSKVLPLRSSRVRLSPRYCIS